LQSEQEEHKIISDDDQLSDRICGDDDDQDVASGFDDNAP